MAPKRVALYLRVSTQDQSTELQSTELLKYAEARGFSVPVIYQDKSTGTNGNRPSLKQLITDIRERKVDLVICWKLDRLFRSLKDLISTLQEWNELGIEFISLKDNIDLTTSAGRLMLHIIGAFGEFEASLIKERVRAGLNAARAKGKKLGRPLERDDAAITRLRSNGMSIRQIAKALNISTTAVQRSMAVTKSHQNNMRKSQ